MTNEAPSNSRHSLYHVRARLNSNRVDLMNHAAQCATCRPQWPCSIAAQIAANVLRLRDEVASLTSEAASNENGGP